MLYVYLRSDFLNLNDLMEVSKSNTELNTFNIKFEKIKVITDILKRVMYVSSRYLKASSIQNNC